MLTRGLIVFTTTLLTCLSTAAIAAPDKIYINGNIITADENFSIVNSLAIEGNKFTAVGNSTEIIPLSDKTTEIIDLQGRTVIPGLIDNHNHFIRGAYQWTNSVRLDGISSRTKALSVLERHAQQLDEDDWLLVLGGWNQEQFTDDPRGFTLEELDSIAGNRPAFIQAQYSHAFVNSAFLQLIDAPLQDRPKQSKKPSSSMIEKRFGPPLASLVERDENGKATSRLNGGMGMVLQVSTLMPSPESSRALESVKAAQQYYNALGITSVYDPGGALASQQASDAIEQLHQNNELSVRVFRTASLSSLSTDTINSALRLRNLPDWLENLILGLIRDTESTADSIQALQQLPPLQTGDDFYDHLAVGEVLYIPMHDSLDSHVTEESMTQHQRNEVEKLLATLLSLGISAQIHAVNTETIDAYLDILEEQSKSYPLKPNQITFTHAEGITEALLQRSHELGISLQIRSMPVVRSVQAIKETYGDDILSAPPLRTIQESGISWGLGTDGTKASQIEPMRTLYWATAGRAINGDQVLAPEQLLSREEALIAHTRSNAELVNRHHKLGQIKPDYLADFVILDTNYLEVDIQDIPSIEVLTTVVSGKTVYKKM